jgi:Kef-type K+ transport system membrane component KefB
MDILFFIGLAILVGFSIGKLCAYFKLPSVVGYLVGGVLLGPSVFRVFSLELLDRLGIFNDLALGLVAFIIGSELRVSVLRKMGRGIITLILSESFGAFFLAALGVYSLTRNLALALIFGAMAPASAPAGTVAVLQEARARGPLTNALYAVVGLDDGLAVIIYAFAAAGVKVFLTQTSFSFLKVIKVPVFEIFGAILLGGLLGIVLGYLTRKLRERNDFLAASLSAILLLSGLAKYLHLSLILSNLTLGMTFANLSLFANRRAYQALQAVTPPIYIIFFVIAGAHLQFKLLPAMGALGVIYIISRILGKLSGASVGARISKAPSVIRKYLGLGILSQAGVAIGLAILTTREFSSLGEAGAQLSLVVINTIAATTIIFEIIGPIATKIAISKANEVAKVEGEQ